MLFEELIADSARDRIQDRKIMAKEDDSPEKRAILEEWDCWAQKHPHDAIISGGMALCTYLQEIGPIYFSISNCLATNGKLCMLGCCKAANLPSDGGCSVVSQVPDE
jgi:hypothetical protein